MTFPVACLKTAKHDAFFPFNFIDRKAAMRNLFINRIETNVYT